jgi:phosphomannomutase
MAKLTENSYRDVNIAFANELSILCDKFQINVWELIKLTNHHPDPTVPEYMVKLRDRVLKTGAVAGIGFDGDADRIGVVDAQGTLLYGDELMVVFARAVLQKHPGTSICLVMLKFRKFPGSIKFTATPRLLI